MDLPWLGGAVLRGRVRVGPDVEAATIEGRPMNSEPAGLSVREA